MKISIICPSEIAYRRFMPALSKADCFEFAGVGYHSKDEIVNLNNIDLESKIKTSREKAQKFINDFGGKLYNSYAEVTDDKNIECIYIPLPPMLHFEYAKRALNNNKHILLEKPATLSHSDMKDLVELASQHELAIHENYMFIYHSQLRYIKEIIDNNELGDIRLIRIAYGFPFRGSADFRYHKKIGGGALLDAGGYTIKLATFLLGFDCKIDSACVSFVSDYDADMFGQGVLINSSGLTAQIAFGMDNDYKCELEIWGSKATLYTNRILTAPIDYNPTIVINRNGNSEVKYLESDDSFYNSIMYFKQCILDETIRKKHYEELLFQSKLFDDFKVKSKVNF